MRSPKQWLRDRRAARLVDEEELRIRIQLLRYEREGAGKLSEDERTRALDAGADYPGSEWVAYGLAETGQHPLIPLWPGTTPTEQRLGPPPPLPSYFGHLRRRGRKLRSRLGDCP